MIVKLVLPEQLRAQLCAEARNAFPNECCGLVEGTKEPVTQSVIPAKAGKGEPIWIARATALHPSPNLASASNRFEIDPARHIALLRRLRGTGLSVIGCYHSHPNGKPDPSVRDRESAGETDFLWLIVAIDADAARDVRIAAFVSTGDSFLPIRVTGAQLDRAAAAPL